MKILKQSFWLLALICILCSCDDFKDSAIYTGKETEKHLDGSWYIAKATRNGLDITNLMDFSKFRITFNSDNTYTIENYLPFLVRENGKWDINDPQRPSLISFKEESVADAKISAFEYLTVNGDRQLVLTFTPGYHTNIYSYVFERVSN